MSVTIKRNGNPLKGVKNGLRVAIRETGRIIETGAKLLAPVDTGNLRQSIESGVVSDTEGFAGIVNGGGEQGYAVYQEFGTRNMAAQPYLRPAAVEAETKTRPIISAMNEAMKREL